MPLHTNTSIRIEGNQGLAQTFNSLDIYESMTGHHTFALNLPGQAFGAGKGTGNWRSLVGKRITIEIAPPKQPAGGTSAPEAKIFTGLITGLSLGKGDGPNGTVIITGGAPTLLLDDDPHTQAFAKQSLQRIVGSQLSQYPKNLLRPNIQPETSGSLEYIVQYKENTWNFLRRLARIYGEWCYYNGENLIFGRRNPETFQLTHNVHLDYFNLTMGLKPVNMTLAGYDYHGDTVTQNETPPPSGLNTYSQTIADAGQSLFPRKGRVHPNHYLNGSASRQVKMLAGRRRDASVAKMVEISGQSHHPGLSVGDEIAVEENLYGSEAYGAFMLSEIHHRCSSDGDYSNSFTGIPADVATPPHHLDDHPIAGPQSAVVTDNNDPDDLGRVRVRMRWQDHGQSPWLRIVAPGGGKDKGFHMIPETGEEVMVDFEGGHPERPYVLGSTRNGSSTSGFGTPNNDIKAIRTRSGHTIELNDNKGGEFITIKDKNGNKINIDTANDNITISAQKNMTLNAKNFELNVKEDANFNIGKNTGLQTGENLDISAKNISQVVQKNVRLENSGKYSQLSAEAAIQSDGDLIFSGAGLASLKGGSDVKVSKG